MDILDRLAKSKYYLHKFIDVFFFKKFYNNIATEIKRSILCESYSTYRSRYSLTGQIENM